MWLYCALCTVSFPVGGLAPAAGSRLRCGVPRRSGRTGTLNRPVQRPLAPSFQAPPSRPSLAAAAQRARPRHKDFARTRPDIDVAVKKPYSDGMSVPRDFHTFDADNHFYETRDAFTRHLPKEYAGAIKYVEVDGRTKIVVGGRDQRLHPQPDLRRRRPARVPRRSTSATAIPRASPTAEIVGEPMRSIPAFREPGPRLEVMDELGLDQSLMFPTLASLLEERMRDDAELTHAAIHALNEWMHETWTFNYKDRIFATPVITLPLVEQAIAELEWCLERGAKTVLIRPAPVPGTGRCALFRHARSSTRSGRRWSRRTSRSRCMPPTAATPAS